jgi:hypothetical protein
MSIFVSLSRTVADGEPRAVEVVALRPFRHQPSTKTTLNGLN